MKYFMLLMVLLGAAACHRKAVVNRIDCCAKAAVAPAAASGSGSGAGGGSTVAAEGGLQSSVYQLPGTWTDQHNHPIALRDLRGKVRVVAMIFTHCAYACPRIVADMKAIQDSLPVAGKSRVGFVLVSFDPEHDDPAQLARFAAQQGLDDQWALLHGDARQVRELSMLLNVRYQDAGEGGFVHSNKIVILDTNGVISRSIEGLDPQTVTATNVINGLASR